MDRNERVDPILLVLLTQVRSNDTYQRQAILYTSKSDHVRQDSREKGRVKSIRKNILDIALHGTNWNTLFGGDFQIDPSHKHTRKDQVV